MELAAALYRAGNLAEANRIAAEVLASAAQAGAVSFVLERPTEFSPVLSLIIKSATDPDARQYAQQLLGKCRERERPASGSRSSDITKQLLTDRERSIVHFIAGGQSNKQVARALGVIPETVKTHVKRIFIKLSAESRAQAVVRAQSLGLLRSMEVN